MLASKFGDCFWSGIAGLGLLAIAAFVIFGIRPAGFEGQSGLGLRTAAFLSVATRVTIEIKQRRQNRPAKFTA
jgi:hypothetical protein